MMSVLCAGTMLRKVASYVGESRQHLLMRKSPEREKHGHVRGNNADVCFKSSGQRRVD